jgi:hypothetical protein
VTSADSNITPPVRPRVPLNKNAVLYGNRQGQGKGVRKRKVALPEAEAAESSELILAFRHDSAVNTRSLAYYYVDNTVSDVWTDEPTQTMV